jgi:hypothetical protein
MVRREQTSESVGNGRKRKGGTEDMSESSSVKVKWENGKRVAVKERNWDD